MGKSADPASPGNAEDAPRPSTAHRRRTEVLSLLLLALGVMSLAYLGGLLFKTLLPGSSIRYPLLAFGQGAEISVRNFEAPAPPPPPPPPPTVLVQPPSGWPVYFPNGSSSLVAGQEVWLSKLAAVLRLCDPLHLRLTGHPSSAKFPKSSDESNLELAMNRAKAVRSFLAERLAAEGLEVVHWDSPGAIELRRTYRDRRQNENVEHPAEFLNRRVDIELGSRSRCPFMSGTAASQPR